jgi:hypothetical protein
LVFDRIPKYGLNVYIPDEAPFPRLSGLLSHPPEAVTPTSKRFEIVLSIEIKPEPSSAGANCICPSPLSIAGWIESEAPADDDWLDDCVLVFA